MLQSRLVFMLILMSVWLCGCHAWFFYRRYPTARADGKDVTNACARLAGEGSCDFYRCFEDRLSCGSKWYNVRYGEPYCRDFESFARRFSFRGQEFINATARCIGDELLPWYEKHSMNCHDYTHFAFKALSRCYIKNGFCEVIKKDALNFITIYRPEHLFSRGAMKIWREILRIAYHCEPKAFHDFFMTMFESIRD